MMDAGDTFTCMIHIPPTPVDPLSADNAHIMHGLSA